MSEEIIAAIATPIGIGGISVIRISGAGACVTIDNIFRGKSPLSEASSHTVHFGTVFDGTTTIDEVVATVYRAPHSYTGEESIELSCHGGLYVTRQILNAVIASGCRHAKPGEFTERAFLNGRIDLVQAEAVADLISAGGESARKSSFEQLQGSLSAELREIREELIRITGLLELELDFVEDDIELASKKEVGDSLKKVIARIHGLISSYSQGKILRDGVKSVIVGKPNAGKSSLLNALLKHDRAIVSATPGTTRDTIEETLSIEGILFRVTDTAGLRPAADEIEKEGITRTGKEIEKADVIVLVVDASKSITDIENSILSFLTEWNTDGVTAIVTALNKTDLIDQAEIAALKNALSYHSDMKFVNISAKTGAGLVDLEKAMTSSIHIATIENTVTVTNARHRDALLRAQKSLSLALESVEKNQSNELIVLDLRAGLNCLGEIIGETTTEDILSKIFSSFCIGK